MIMNKIILFDLGDTLIYRDNSLFNWDVDLCIRFLGEGKKLVEGNMLKLTKKYPGMYDPTLQRMESLIKEDKYTRTFFRDVVKQMGIDPKILETLIQKRKKQVRYKLFEFSTNILSALKSNGYHLGIMSNGRPSRRRILKQLCIKKYFADELIFISDELGRYKPNYEFYQYVSEQNPDTTITLCDDELSNLEVAQRLGWNAIHVNHQS